MIGREVRTVRRCMSILYRAAEWPRHGESFAAPLSGIPDDHTAEEQRARVLLETLGLWESAAREYGIETGDQR